jgi:phenylacetate-CoA ligase
MFRAEIESLQLARLRALLARVTSDTFYGRKFAGLPAPESLADFSRNFPFTTKSELAADQIQNPPFGTVLLEPIENYTRFHQTSGTTSAPIRWLDTPDAWNAIVECWMEVFTTAGVTRADRIFFAFSFGPFLGFWMAFGAAQRLGCLCISAGGMTSAARLRMLIDTKSTVLCCTPTYAARLAEAAAEEKIDLRQSSVRHILVAGEGGGSIPAVRARLEQLWPGARVFDHHGMTEVGPVTYECPVTPCRLHVMEHSFIAEILDPNTSTPVAPGQPGELVLTTLVRKSSPLFRYRTGDLVRSAALNAGRTGVSPISPGVSPGGICACGRAELALQGGILGRADDMAVVRGVNVYPTAVEDILAKFPEIAEYRVTLTTKNSLTELQLEIEPRPNASANIAATLQHALQTAFNLRIPVHTVAPNTLPRSEMKSKRWIRA